MPRLPPELKTNNLESAIRRVQTIFGSGHFLRVSKFLLKEIGSDLTLTLTSLLEMDAYYRHRHLDNRGWFYRTAEARQEATGLTRTRERAAVEALEALGLIKTALFGMPKHTYFQIQYERLDPWYDEILCNLDSADPMTGVPNPDRQAVEDSLQDPAVHEQDLTHALQDPAIRLQDPATYNRDLKTKTKTVDIIPLSLEQLVAPHKRKNVTAKHRIRVSQNTPLMETLGRLIGRRPSTKWTVYETEGLLECNPTDEEIKVVEQYYSHPFPAEQDFRRRSLDTLFNHWPGEVDKATKWLKTSGRQSTPPPGLSRKGRIAPRC